MVQGPREDFVGGFVSNDRLIEILSDSSLYTAELYDMRNDEGEEHDMAEFYPSKVEELVGLIREEVRNVKGTIVSTCILYNV